MADGGTDGRGHGRRTIYHGGSHDRYMIYLFEDDHRTVCREHGVYCHRTRGVNKSHENCSMIVLLLSIADDRVRKADDTARLPFADCD